MDTVVLACSILPENGLADELKAAQANVTTIGDANGYRRLEQSVSFDVDPPATPFLGPALFVLGRQDHVVGYRAALRLETQYPRATVAVLGGAGHSLPWERPGPFAALVGDWLDRLDGR